MPQFKNIQSINKPAKSTLKILLKTKNDDFFLERWIQHHKDIVGLNNLIIIDNNSTNEKTISILKKFENKISIFSYQGFHNDLHRPHINKEIYDYLSNNTKYYIFLDTDEFLDFYESDGTKLKYSNALDLLSKCNDEIVFGKWIQCSFGNKNKYYLKSNPNDVMLGIKSGKPILAPKTNITDIINHNFQAIKFYNQTQLTFPYAFVKHQKFENYQQRIDTNYEKLLAYNAFKKQKKIPTIPELVKLDPNQIEEGNARNWTKEIIKLTENIKSSTTSKAADIIDDHNLYFNNKTTINNFKKFFDFSSKEYISIMNNFKGTDNTPN